MTKISRLFSLSVALMFALSAFVLTGCNDDDDNGPMTPTQNIVQLATANPNLSTLVTAINAAGLGSTLSGQGPFTVFAPNNAAFNALPSGTLDALLANPSDLAEILQYHVVGQRLLQNQLSSGMVASLLPDAALNVNVSGGNVRINDAANVVTANQEATNGVVHVIDAVLLPPQEDLPNIVEIVLANENLSTLGLGVAAFPAVLTALQGDGPFTVFAPTNQAFNDLVDADDRFSNVSDIPEETLLAILQYHLIAGSELFSNNLADGAEVETLQGEKITVSRTNGGVILNGDANVTTADVDASNGVVHIINKVLLPPSMRPQTIAQLAVATPELSILVSILTSPGFEDLLAAASDASAGLTVFAPTNAAFEGLLEALGKTALSEIPASVVREIVEYHILGTVALASSLEATTYPTLLDGESVTVTLGDNVKIDDATVVIPDVVAANGVVHVIDAVLIPSLYKAALGTIVQVPLFSNDFTTLVAALRKANLVGALLSDDVTIFAPNNAAFEAAGITSLDGLSAEDLAPILTYHVVGGKVRSGDLAGIANGIVTPLSGSKFFLSLGDEVFINGDVQVTGVDIELGNGVIHTISKTLIPPTQSVVEIAVALSQADEPQFTQLVGLLTRPGQADVLSAISDEDGNFTIFAPVDAAFEAIAETAATLTEAQISGVLTYHVIAGDRPVFSTDLVDGLEATTVNGQSITINLGEGATITDTTPNAANIIQVNVLGNNGVIHVIDKVLLPTL
ncbi:MAG: fasciclin domain-containing protein [Cyclobacteriaceae bacterium]|nr:fasciclin domain-containing protein [Cyclobacteriaceae bacterium]